MKAMISSKELITLIKKIDEVIAQKFYSMLPIFGYINLTICSGTAIYRSYNNKNTQMMVFNTFVYFGTLLMDYCFRVHYTLPRSDKSPRKRNAKIGMWVLLSSIMLGFAIEFSSFKYLAESLCLFGIVIGGNTLLFYVYFIWEGNKCDDNDACFNQDSCCCCCCCCIEIEDQKEYESLIEAKGEARV